MFFNSFLLFPAPGFYSPVNRPVTYPKDIHQFFNAPAGFEQPFDFPGAELPHSAVFAQPPIVKAFGVRAGQAGAGVSTPFILILEIFRPGVSLPAPDLRLFLVSSANLTSLKIHIYTTKR
jgi:hypothetical protein